MRVQCCTSTFIDVVVVYQHDSVACRHGDLDLVDVLHKLELIQIVLELYNARKKTKQT